MVSNYKQSSEKYKPEKIKFLLIAEAPGSLDTFFYNEEDNSLVTLSLETMKVVYGDLEKPKINLLEYFQNDGFYLVDVCDEPIKGTPAEKKRQLEKCLNSLIEKVSSLVSDDTKIILISARVYAVCYDRLKKEGFNVINESMIPFPIGYQREFREKLTALLKKHGWQRKK